MEWLKLAHAQSFMPTQATKIAAEYDSLYGFLVVSSLISCVILIGGMIYFVIKYKRKTDQDKTAYITHNTFLEFLWSFIPLCIFMLVFVWGWFIYYDMRTVPKDAFEVNVVGKQWSWDFFYKSGKKMTNEFVVPINTPVKLIMTSKDVIHSFYVPSFRIKQDVVPGRYTALWFEANKLGDFQVFCTEYCGLDHSRMYAKVKVVQKDEFEKWLAAGAENLPPLELGKKVYQNQCFSCHTTDGSPKVGPSFKGIFGKDEQLADGSTVKVDENYIHESILQPQAKVVKGFPPAMPSFQGSLTEEEIAGFIEYLKSLK